MLFARALAKSLPCETVSTSLWMSRIVRSFPSVRYLDLIAHTIESWSFLRIAHVRVLDHHSLQPVSMLRTALLSWLCTLDSTMYEARYRVATLFSPNVLRTSTSRSTQEPRCVSQQLDLEHDTSIADSKRSRPAHDSPRSTCTIRSPITPDATGQCQHKIFRHLRFSLHRRYQ